MCSEQSQMCDENSKLVHFNHRIKDNKNSVSMNLELEQFDVF